MPENLDQSQRLVDALIATGACGPPAAAISTISTHSAWILLTGEFAYKIKKPVNFGFLDYSTLEKRRHYCEEELRLNRRFAADLYLDVVPITGGLSAPEFGGSGPVLEYALRMRQFPTGALLSELAERGELQAGHIDRLIETVGEFHRQAERADGDGPYGVPERVRHWVIENFDQIAATLPETSPMHGRLSSLRAWVEDRYQALGPLLARRRQQGFIRECHGDLHLGNITLIDGQPTPFDCIEFNPELRWIDVISEIAFLIMDLRESGNPRLANRFLNGYLQHDGDYDGLRLLPFYLVYRALVRAKVAMLHRQQSPAGSNAYRAAWRDFGRYLSMAEAAAAPPPVALIITHGLSGSGKSTLAQALCERLGIVHIRADIERKRLAGLTALQSSRSELDTGLYSAQRTEQTYRRLTELAGSVVGAGLPVLLDATFLARAQRQRMAQLAMRLGVSFAILHCDAPTAVLERRVRARQQAANDASEATPEVLRAQLDKVEPLDARERERRLYVDTDQADALETATAALASLLNDDG